MIQLKIVDSSFRIVPLPALSDNYIYLLIEEKSALIVDPSESKSVLSFLNKYELECTAVLCTHHHFDHVGGVGGIKAATGCPVYGPDDDRIIGLDRAVRDGSRIGLGWTELEVLSVPGHTSTHLAYYCAGQHTVFTGDCLFCGGCGRLFEGTAEEMWNSLKKLMGLAPQTMIFPGHEYTLENMQFAAFLEPENPRVQKRLEEVRLLRRKNMQTIPSLLCEEKKSNPFLRVNEPAVQSAVNLLGSEEVEVFAAIRKLKDRF